MSYSEFYRIAYDCAIQHFFRNVSIFSNKQPASGKKKKRGVVPVLPYKQSIIWPSHYLVHKDCQSMVFGEIVRSIITKNLVLIWEFSDDAAKHRCRMYFDCNIFSVPVKIFRT